MENRAYSVVTIKSMDDERRIITGMATTPEVDSYGDIVEPKGVRTRGADVPLFLYHDSEQTIGRARLGKATVSGVPFEATIPKVIEEGRLKERVDEAWQMLKYKLITGVSIGFSPVADKIERLKDGGVRYLESLIHELSLVPIPANGGATVTAIKSADAAMRALSGRGASGSAARSPALSGNPAALSGQSQRKTMKTLAQLNEELATKQARATEIIDLQAAEKRAFTDDERAELNQLDTDVARLQDDVVIKRFQDRQASTAAAVSKGSPDDQRASRGPVIHVKQDPDPDFKGQPVARWLMCKAVSWIEMKKGNFITPLEIAKHRYGQRYPGQIKMFEAAMQRAAVAGGGTGSGEWGAELSQRDTQFTGDFIEMLYGRALFDKVGFRNVPSRIRIKGQDGEATGYWVGESKAIKVSKPDFSEVDLDDMKVGVIAVCSKDLVFSSEPSAEQLIMNSLIEASAKRIDDTVWSTDAVSSGVSPAGLGNGLSALAPSATDAAAVRNDLLSLYSGFLTAKNASGLIHVMTPGMAKAISLMVNANGVKEFPDLNATGGTLEGDPVFTGDNVDGGDWWLLKPTDVWKIGDRGVEVSMSDTVTIEQNDAPQGASDTPTAASATLMSMWQTESVAFKVVRHCNVQKRRSTAVALLQNAEYGGVIS